MGEQTTTAYRILVVDDEATVVEMLATVLEAHGFAVVSASDGAEAVNRFDETSDDFDCIITDLQMPHMDGFALEEYVHTAHQARPMIAISGNLATDHNLIRAKDRFDAVLAKPFSISDLITVIKQVLDGHAEQGK